MENQLDTLKMWQASLNITPSFDLSNCLKKKKKKKMTNFRSHVRGVPESTAIETDGKDLGLKLSNPFSP